MKTNNIKYTILPFWFLIFFSQRRKQDKDVQSRCCMLQQTKTGLFGFSKREFSLAVSCCRLRLTYTARYDQRPKATLTQQQGDDGSVCSCSHIAPEISQQISAPDSIMSPCRSSWTQICRCQVRPDDGQSQMHRKQHRLDRERRFQSELQR